MDTPLPYHQGLPHGWVIWLVHTACTQADLKLMTLSLIPLPRLFLSIESPGAYYHHTLLAVKLCMLRALWAVSLPRSSRSQHPHDIHDSLPRVQRGDPEDTRVGTVPGWGRETQMPLGVLGVVVHFQL